MGALTRICLSCQLLITTSRFFASIYGGCLILKCILLLADTLVLIWTSSPTSIYYTRRHKALPLNCRSERRRPTSTHCSNTKSAFLLDSTLYSTFVGSWLVLLLSRSQNQVWTLKTHFSGHSKLTIDMVDNISNCVLSNWEVPINMRAAFFPPYPHLGGAMKGGGSKEFNETISFWHNVTCFKKSFYACLYQLRCPF